MLNRLDNLPYVESFTHPELFLKLSEESQFYVHEFMGVIFIQEMIYKHGVFIHCIPKTSITCSGDNVFFF